MPNKKISVVVEAAETVFTEDGIQLYQTLDSLKHQNYPADKREVIVVICGWSENEKESFKRDYPDFILAETKDGGYFRVKNFGGSVATGEVIALADGDCIYSPDWLAAINESVKDDMTIATGLTILDKGTLITRICNFYDMHWMLFRHKGSVRRFNSNNVGIPAKLFKEIHYDPYFDRFGGCVNLAWRLNNAGAKFEFSEKQTTRHNYYGLFRHSWVHAIANGYNTLVVRERDKNVPLSGLLNIKPLAPFIFAGIFLATDVVNLLQNKKLLKIKFYELPLFLLFQIVVRIMEVTGMYWVMVSPAGIEEYIQKRVA